MNKKGQITIFVIIGIVLLIGAALFFFLNSTQQETPQEDIENELVDVEEEYRPVDLYVKSCLSSIGVSVLEQIGQHGGYLNPLEELEFDPSKPYDSDGLLLTSSEKSFIPYWSYIESPTEEDLTIYPSIKIPELEEIQRTHAAEIDDSLLDCLDNFTNLEFRGSDIEIKEQPQSKVTYTQDSVIIQTDLPLTITSSDGLTKNIDSFYSIIEIPFKKYYDLSRFIVSQQYENQYLENLITLLIGYYGKIDSNSIPPFFGITQGYGYEVWTQTDVNQKLKTLLLDNVPLIQVQGTNNTYDVESLGLDQRNSAFLNSLNMPLFLLEHPELEVTHIYLDWPIYSKVWPSQGEIIRPNPNNHNIPMFHNSQDQTYNFFYDIAYPVVIELREKDAYLGEDFVFMFAMESNIRKNLDWRAYANDAGPIITSGEDVEVGIVQDEEQLDPITNNTYSVPTMSKKLFNDKSQFISQPIKVKTIDYRTGLPLENVDVQVGVGTYARSIIGSTEINNGEAVFEGSGPLIKNGYVSLNKNGYLSESEFITLDNSTTPIDLATISLLPLEEKEIFAKVFDMTEFSIPDLPRIHEEIEKVKNLEELEYLLSRITLENQNVLLDGERVNSEPGFTIISVEKLFERNITDTESIILNIDYIPLEGKTSKHTSFAQFTGNISSQASVKLVPGRYELSGMLFDNDGVIIPEKSKKICNGDDCDKIPEENQYIPEDPIEMKPAIWGGLEFNETMPWFISADDTYSENNITFYFLKFSQPESIDDISKIGDLAKISSTYRSKLLPELTYPIQ